MMNKEQLQEQLNIKNKEWEVLSRGFGPLFKIICDKEYLRALDEKATKQILNAFNNADKQIAEVKEEVQHLERQLSKYLKGEL